MRDDFKVNKIIVGLIVRRLHLSWIVAIAVNSNFNPMDRLVEATEIAGYTLEIQSIGTISRSRKDASVNVDKVAGFKQNPWVGQHLSFEQCCSFTGLSRNLKTNWR